jgi:hypothetical protein
MLAGILWKLSFGDLYPSPLIENVIFAVVVSGGVDLIAETHVSNWRSDILDRITTWAVRLYTRSYAGLAKARNLRRSYDDILPANLAPPWLINERRNKLVGTQLNISKGLLFEGQPSEDFLHLLASGSHFLLIHRSELQLLRLGRLEKDHAHRQPEDDACLQGGRKLDACFACHDLFLR